MITDRLGLTREQADPQTLERTVDYFRQARIALPTFTQLAHPTLIPAAVREALADVGPDDPHPLNLFRVHWHNGANRTDFVDVPEHIVLPPELTGVEARIVLALGNRFPLIEAHKVLAAYGCLVPRLVTGRFDPTSDRAVWPSTGNYCRGGVAISRLLGCHGVAVLPEGMSRERFAWLERWVVDPGDIIRTPGTESNVKEIYDKCHELSEDPDNVILNQFAEFGNHIAHYLMTGAALERVFESMREQEPSLRLRAFVSATGSAGTIGAGDYLKERLGSLIVAVEAAECPTMLRNGFGEHNIQGIGDKHIPLIHNVLNTDVAARGVRPCDRPARGAVQHRRGSPVPRRALRRLRGRPRGPPLARPLEHLQPARRRSRPRSTTGSGPEDVIVTVATDGASLYESEHELALAKYFSRGFDEVAAGEVFGEHLLGAATDNLLELTSVDRDRIFNLGYYTWVEQQGISLEDFEARRSPEFWSGIHELVGDWDALIDDFNARTGVLEAL